MIHGISGYGMQPVLPGGTRTPGTHETDTAPSRETGHTRAPQAPAPRAAARAHETVPAEAPAGTDPMLWSVLTSEERSFFARARAMGQLTYGPGSRAHGGLPTGGRIDVRV